MSRKRSREVVGKDDFRVLLDGALSSDEMFRGTMRGIAFAELRAADMWGLPDVDFEETGPRYVDVRSEIAHWEYCFDRIRAFTESPIEKKALMAFLLLAQVRKYPLGVTEPKADFPADFGSWRQMELPEDDPAMDQSVYVTPQAGIPGLNIRVDAACWRMSGTRRPLVVEFDGYEWHKGNFTADRQRDRDLRLAGFEVVRFSGAEINADPLAVAVHLDALLRETQGIKGFSE